MDDADSRRLLDAHAAEVRAAAFTEAADAVLVDTAHIRYGSATDYAERHAALLRRMAHEGDLTMTDLPALRAAAYRFLDACHDAPVPRRWRTVITDSESLTGYAPVCTVPHPAIPEAGVEHDDTGVYDCCDSIVETFSEGMAAYVVALLNADAVPAAVAVAEGGQP